MYVQGASNAAAPAHAPVLPPVAQPVQYVVGPQGMMLARDINTGHYYLISQYPQAPVVSTGQIPAQPRPATQPQPAAGQFTPYPHPQHVRYQEPSQEERDIGTFECLKECAKDIAEIEVLKRVIPEMVDGDQARLQRCLLLQYKGTLVCTAAGHNNVAFLSSVVALAGLNERPEVIAQIINTTSGSGLAPFMAACKHGSYEAVQWLINHGANIDKILRDRTTLFQHLLSLPQRHISIKKIQGKAAIWQNLRRIAAQTREQYDMNDMRCHSSNNALIECLERCTCYNSHHRNDSELRNTCHLCTAACTMPQAW